MPASSKSKTSKSRKGGRKGWTNLEQYTWLQEQVPTYLEIRADGRGNLDRFWIQLFDGWFKRWPEESDENVGDVITVRAAVHLGSELINYPF